MSGSRGEDRTFTEQHGGMKKKVKGHAMRRLKKVVQMMRFSESTNGKYYSVALQNHHISLPA